MAIIVSSHHMTSTKSRVNMLKTMHSQLVLEQKDQRQRRIRDNSGQSSRSKILHPTHQPSNSQQFLFRNCSLLTQIYAEVYKHFLRPIGRNHQLKLLEKLITTSKSVSIRIRETTPNLFSHQAWLMNN